MVRIVNLNQQAIKQVFKYIKNNKSKTIGGVEILSKSWDANRELVGIVCRFNGHIDSFLSIIKTINGFEAHSVNYLIKEEEILNIIDRIVREVKNG